MAQKSCFFSPWNYLVWELPVHTDNGGHHSRGPGEPYRALLPCRQGGPLHLCPADELGGTSFAGFVALLEIRVEESLLGSYSGLQLGIPSKFRKTRSLAECERKAVPEGPTGDGRDPKWSP